jgi:sugar/nucleoside kinase (ribokinase family)
MDKTLIIGAAMVDNMLELDRLPAPGEDIFARNEQRLVGGCALNVATVLKAFNVPYELLVPVGNGRNAAIVREEMLARGFRIVLEVDSGDNGYCLALVDNQGERTLITLPGIELFFKPDWFDRVEASQFARVYVTGYEIGSDGGGHFLAFLKGHPHLKIFFAPGPRISYIPPERMNSLLGLGPVLHLNRNEALSYTRCDTINAAISYIQNKTHAPVIVTCGAEGAVVADDSSAPGGAITAVPVRPARVVDTAGAGDAHMGGLLTALGYGKPLVEAVQFANLVAASVVEKMGAQFIADKFFNGDRAFDQ